MMLSICDVAMDFCFCNQLMAWPTAPAALELAVSISGGSGRCSPAHQFVFLAVMVALTAVEYPSALPRLAEQRRSLLALLAKSQGVGEDLVPFLLACASGAQKVLLWMVVDQKRSQAIRGERILLQTLVPAPVERESLLLSRVLCRHASFSGGSFLSQPLGPSNNQNAKVSTSWRVHSPHAARDKQLEGQCRNGDRKAALLLLEGQTT